MLIKIKNWILKMLSNIGFSINIKDEPKIPSELELFPNIKKTIRILSSCTNEIQRSTALNFARLAIKKDMTIVQFNNDKNLLFFEREVMMQNLVDLSDIILDRIGINQENMNLEKIEKILNNIRYRDYLKLQKQERLKI